MANFGPLLGDPGAVRWDDHHGGMWQVEVVCPDPDCGEEFELWVEELDEVDRAVCICECGVVALSVATFEPVSLPSLVPA